MTVESHLPFGGESNSPQDEADFEPTKSRRKSRRERRTERARSRERAPESHTIWTREDPNHLQPLATAGKAPERVAPEHNPAHPEQKPAKKVEHAPKPAQTEATAEVPGAPSAGPGTEQMYSPEAAMPAPQKHEASARERSQPESLAELLKLQELPKLNIQRRHFYTEPEVRQPNTTETEHDILPSTRQEKQSSGPMAGTEQAPTTVERSSIDEQQKIFESQPENESKQLQSSSKESPDHTDKHEGASQASKVSEYPAHLRAGEELQHIADETARRATELADKEEHRAQPEEQQASTMPEVSETSAVPEAQVEENKVDFRMEQADLLDIGDSIRVDGVSVSEMFRAGRLDVEGMRRIVAAFLRGQDVQRVIAEEVLRVQMRFELDPQLRKAALKRSSRPTKRAAARATTRAKKVLDPKRAKYHADRMADRVVSGLDRMIEVAEEKPNTAKTVGIALAVVLYFVILILILRS